MKLTILIPTYKEEKRIGQTLDELAKYLSHARLEDDTEVFVFDSASPDKTQEVAKAKAGLFKNFRVESAVKHEGPQKGKDVAEGMMKSRGIYVLFMDADLATPLHHVEDVLKLADEGYKVVIGVRDVSKSHKGIVRKLISWGGNILVQTLILPGIKDSQTGFKLFERETARQVFSRLTITGWTFDMEALAIAKKRFKLKIATVDLSDWRDVAGGTFKPSAKVAIASILDVFKIRFNLWTGKYR